MGDDNPGICSRCVFIIAWLPETPPFHHSIDDLSHWLYFFDLKTNFSSTAVFVPGPRCLFNYYGSFIQLPVLPLQQGL
jgi:hypothetical protein